MKENLVIEWYKNVLYPYLIYVFQAKPKSREKVLVFHLVRPTNSIAFQGFRILLKITRFLRGFHEVSRSLPKSIDAHSSFFYMKFGEIN